jgi:hypothetical protein
MIDITPSPPVLTQSSRQAVYSRDDAPNNIISSVAIMNDALHNFQTAVEELSFFAAAGTNFCTKTSPLFLLYQFECGMISRCRV